MGNEGSHFGKRWSHVGSEDADGGGVAVVLVRVVVGLKW